ncbi:MAG: T9SS type A sorting domain-containing protein [Bacteroidales bacterium]
MKQDLLIYIISIFLLFATTSTRIFASSYNSIDHNEAHLITNNNTDDKSLTIKGIYPNPVHTELNLELSTTKSGNVKIFVYNLLGQQVSDLGEHYISDFDTNTLSFDVSTIKNGLYIIIVKSDNAIKSVKMRKIQ